MGYTCSNDGMDFPTKRELIEHIHEKYGCTFLEGDWKDDAKKLLEARKAKGNDSKADALLEKHKHARME